jgi:nucleoside phosphorylase
VEYRDAPGRPDAALVKRLRDGARDFAGAQILIGKLLSGSDLVDNEEHRDELVRHAAREKAIGGEMELAGLFAASERRRGRWAAAKAICDFADGRKGVDKAARQALAAHNAARFVRHVIDQGLLGSPP